MIRTIEEGDYTLTFSDTGHRIMRAGASYDEALDPTVYQRAYSESAEYCETPRTAADWWEQQVAEGKATDEEIPQYIQDYMARERPEEPEDTE